jgi:hypothetical protein
MSAYNRPDIDRRYTDALLRAVKEQRKRTPKDPTGYIRRHELAFMAPTKPFEQAIVQMLLGLKHYASDHENAYGSKLADDGVIGEAWLDALRGLRAMLNGQLGRLDGGFLDAAICNLYREAGFDGEL